MWVWNCLLSVSLPSVLPPEGMSWRKTEGDGREGKCWDATEKWSCWCILSPCICLCPFPLEKWRSNSPFSLKMLWTVFLDSFMVKSAEWSQDCGIQATSVFSVYKSYLQSVQPVTVSSGGSNKLWSFTGGRKWVEPLTETRGSLGHESNEQVTWWMVALQVSARVKCVHTWLCSEEDAILRRVLPQVPLLPRLI